MQFDLFSDSATPSSTSPTDVFYLPLREKARKLLGEGKAFTQPSHPVSVKGPDGKSTYSAGPTATWIPARGEFKRKVLFVCQSPSKLDATNQVLMLDDSGLKLQTTLSKKVGINFNSDCRVTSLIKYPVDNSKNPPKEAIELCLPLLLEEIQALKPDIVICLGSNVFKLITDLAGDIDEYYGNSVFCEKLNTKVGLVYPPSTALAAPDMEPMWVIDLRMVFNKHNPYMATTIWEEQDKLPTHTIASTAQLAAIVQQHVIQGVKDYAVDTEYDPKRDWLDAVCFKITISSGIDNIDLHLYRPKQGYKPIYVPATVGRHKDVPEMYFKGNPHRLFFPEQSDFDKYLKDFPHRKAPLHVFVGVYEWDFNGTPEELRNLLTVLLCRPGNRIWGQNGRDDYKLIYRLGVNLLPFVIADTITLAKCIDDNAPLALESLSKQWLAAPSHKLKLVQWLHENKVKGGKLPYVFIPRSIIDPYAVTDSRRTYDLYPTFMAELDRQDAEARAVGEPSLKDAYFYAKMPEFFTLIAMELVGQPINVDNLMVCMDWYSKKRKELLEDCIHRVTTTTSLKTFSPDSTDDVRKLLYEELGLTPVESTDGMPWTEVEALPLAERRTKTPGVDKNTLKLLSADHPLCNLLHAIRVLGTLENNYLRCGARWQLPDVEEEGAEPAEEAFSLDFGSNVKEKKAKKVKRTKLQKILSTDDLTDEEYWEEFEADAASKSMSQSVNNNGYLYTAYFELLETHRLASQPNVSAISKGESKNIYKLVGEKPPLAIRSLIEPHHKPVNIQNFLKQKAATPNVIVYDTPKDMRDWVIIESDWTAGEVWYLMALAKDKEGCTIMGDPKRDIHASMARRMFPDRIPKDMSDLDIKEKFETERGAAKPFVFGIPYGRGSRALVKQLNTEAAQAGLTIRYKEEEGEKYILAYQESFPEAWEFLMEQKERVIDPGYLVSPWGFKRRFPAVELLSKAQLAGFQREALNWQIQHGLAATMMEATKAYLEYKRKFPKMPCFMIDILHDATKYICHASVLDEAIKMVHYTMDDGIILPFQAGARLRHTVEVGYNWCGEKLKPEALAALSRKEIDWQDVTRLVPTADLAESITQSLNHNQIRPQHLYELAKEYRM